MLLRYLLTMLLLVSTGITLRPSVALAQAAKKNILMIAGKPSHGYGSHEHFAGLKILEQSINASTDNAAITVVKGWPDNKSLVDQADSIVIYCDGGKRHLAIEHLDTLQAKLSKGCGLVCIHYAVEMVPGPPGDAWVEMLGGHFEINWSVNPHWVADFKSLPNHSITRGVGPFGTNDEWYFHMRFQDSDRVIPILAAVAPEETMRRRDGPHSGNPAVRKSVAAGDKQTVAWAYERPDGGRSFGFTGGHYHWNWGNDNVRRLVTNAIRWSAGDSIPSDGSSLEEKVGIDDLLKNQDYPQPEKFDKDKTAEKFELGMSDATGKSDVAARELFVAPVLTAQSRDHTVDIETSIRGVRDLYLVVTDGGDSYTCDWADWIDPVTHGKGGKLSLVDIDWVSATSGFGIPHKNANCAGKPWSVGGNKIGAAAIGTHANSIIHYRLPKGFDRFTVTGGLDTGGTSQAAGKAASVRFAVFADAPPPNLNGISGDDDIRDAENAIKGLEIGAGLEVTLSASEPQLRSLTNLDIDDRGRVWVCDVMNYRRNNGSTTRGRSNPDSGRHHR